MSSRLLKKVALVTGGASGLGLAIALRLQEEGALVVIGDRLAEQGAAVAQQHGFGFHEHDVRHESQWREVIEAIEAKYARLDVLVNNAGIAGSVSKADPEHSSLEDWQAVFAVNVDGVFLGCRSAIPALRRAGGGNIVNVSSIAALKATPYATAYGASKAAVRQLTKSVAQYCAQEGLRIRCNSVHPGTVRTALWERYVAEAALARGISEELMMQAERDEIPLGDFTTPEDVAAAVAFLCSADARHITGEMLVVDGGFTHCDTYQARAKAPRE